MSTLDEIELSRLYREVIARQQQEQLGEAFVEYCEHEGKRKAHDETVHSGTAVSAFDRGAR